MHLIFLGPPGVGKGTQAKKVCDHYKIIHLSTGEILRKEISDKSEVGILINKILKKSKYKKNIRHINFFEQKENR